MENTKLLNEVVHLMNQLKEELESMPKKYYRNKHLKKYFGLSDNTISEYRDKNIIPWTKLGAIYFYPIDKINMIFKRNSNFDLLDF